MANDECDDEQQDERSEDEGVELASEQQQGEVRKVLDEFRTVRSERTRCGRPARWRTDGGRGVVQCINGYEGGTPGFVLRAGELAARYGERLEPSALLLDSGAGGGCVVTRSPPTTDG